MLNDHKIDDPTIDSNQVLYQKLKKIGTGAFGLVYKGLDIKNDKKVAIKFEKK